MGAKERAQVIFAECYEERLPLVEKSFTLPAKTFGIGDIYR